MADKAAGTGPFRTAELPQNRPTRFAVAPGADARAGIADELGATSIRKLVFEGEIRPLGKHGFRMVATLGATVVQPCVVTLDPVTSRIDETIERSFVPEARLDSPEAGSEVEMPEDDSVEPLGPVIDPAAVMVEALSLAMPDFPRAEGAGGIAAESRPEGAEPIREEEVRAFAGLAALRDKLAEDGEDGA